MKPKPWTILTSHLDKSYRVFNLRTDRACSPRTGLAQDFFIMESSSWVNIIPLTPQKEVVLVRQYRHGTREITLEIPGGLVEHQDNPEEAALRELSEETGYRAKRFSVFLDVFPTPGFLEERMFILLAEGLTAGEAQPEEDEKIEARAYSLKELKQMIYMGKLRDAKSVAGILYYVTFLRKER